MVEFALVLPLLLTLVFGIVEFGRGYNVKVELTGAVREGARALALGKTPAEAKQAVIDAAPGLTPALGAGAITTSACPAGGAEGNATVSVAYSLPLLTPLSWRCHQPHGHRSHAMRSVSEERGAIAVMVAGLLVVF